MPKANMQTEFRNLRPIKGTPYERDWEGDDAKCSHCGNFASFIIDKPIASPYSAAPTRTRTYRLCPAHAARFQED